jgi:hypothetical protein
MNDDEKRTKPSDPRNLPTRPMGAIGAGRSTRASGSVPPPLDPDAAGPRNQGEGNRVAARRYDEGVRAHVAAGRSEPAARAARNSLDGKFAETLRKAEAAGRAPAQTGLIERAVGLVRRVLDWDPGRGKR